MNLPHSIVLASLILATGAFLCVAKYCNATRYETVRMSENRMYVFDRSNGKIYGFSNSGKPHWYVNDFIKGGSEGNE